MIDVNFYPLILFISYCGLSAAAQCKQLLMVGCKFWVLFIFLRLYPDVLNFSLANVIDKVFVLGKYLNSFYSLSAISNRNLSHSQEIMLNIMDVNYEI